MSQTLAFPAQPLAWRPGEAPPAPQTTEDLGIPSDRIGELLLKTLVGGEASGGELADLVAFLYFLNYFDEPGDPRVGKILFSEKHCIRCHRVEQEGGSAGPPLDAIPRGTSPLIIAEALWNHGPAMMSAIEAAGLSVPQFAGSEIIDLFAYVRSHGARTGSQRFQSPGDPTRGRSSR